MGRGEDDADVTRWHGVSRRDLLKGTGAAAAAAFLTACTRGATSPSAGASGAMSRSLVLADNVAPSVSVVARFRLLDSGKLHGQAVEARAAAEELLHRMEDMKRQIGLEVATAAVTLDSAAQRVRVAQDAVVQAEEDYRMALKRYQAQVGTNIDVLDARLALTDAKNALADSVAEARTAYGDLLYAMGDTRP